MKRKRICRPHEPDHCNIHYWDAETCPPWKEAATPDVSVPPGPSPLDTRCTCGHPLGDHRAGGGDCMERDRSLPCGCASFEPRNPPGGVGA